MPFPIEFAKKRGDYDCVSPIINFVGNAAVVAVGGVGVGAISYYALKKLGYSDLIRKSVVVTPMSIGAIGLACAVVGGGFLLKIAHDVGESIGRR